MAASSIPGFAARTELKRKRRDDGYESDSKKRNFSQLPIRAPPPPVSVTTHPQIAITRTFSQSDIPARAYLTPDSISEADSSSNRPDELWSQTSQQQQTSSQQRLHSDSNTSCSSNSSSSLRVHVDNDENVDMEMSSSPKLARIGRARSNDIMSPVHDRSAHLLSPPMPSSSSLLEERIPTPMAATFGARSSYDTPFAPSSARSMASRTALTPMMTEESWTPQMQQHQENMPPQHQQQSSTFSPDSEDPDPDTMMIVENASNELDALSVNCNYEHQTGDALAGNTLARQNRRRQQQHGLGLENATPTADADETGNRTARLHMGFRSDCEKCIQRVPGHYSHIMWS